MSFVEFNETTGEIISVGNMFEKDKLCIPIDPKIAKALISGTEQSINWRVVPDKKESQKYKIIKIEKNVNEEFISTSIFPIERLPAHHKEKNIFQIIQKENVWQGKAILDNDKKTFYTSREGYFGHQKIFYITERNDKRRFLESFSLDFENFFSQQQFLIDCNIDTPCDIYVASGNDKFVHVSDI